MTDRPDQPEATPDAEVAWIDTELRELRSFVMIETGHLPTVRAVTMVMNRVHALADHLAQARDERVEVGRVKHGVGPSEDFAGNVCHLVSPIVGRMRLRERDREPLDDLAHFIDRLTLVLDMARQHADRFAQAQAPTDAREALEKLARRHSDEGVGEWSGRPHVCGGCGHDWPCVDRQIIDAALADREATSSLGEGQA